MKEILYIQAGTFANYIGTHFWNTQEAYFTCCEDAEPLTSHDISFHERFETHKGHPTSCPRLLVFDYKSNFGAPPQTNSLPRQIEQDYQEPTSTWDGDKIEYVLDPIARNRYQDHLNNESTEKPCSKFSEAVNSQLPNDPIRYFSDFNRVDYAPRTVQKIPDNIGLENTDGNWQIGKEMFMQYNEGTALMEESVRLFLEECDYFQGLQIMNDTSTFGGFIDSFLTSFHDEFSKHSCLTFPLLSDAIPGHIDINDRRGLTKAVKDAMCLRGLNDILSFNIPIRSPSSWYPNSWDAELDFDRSIYQSSSIISAHIETSTLPLRLRDRNDDIMNFSAQLNWHGVTRFGELSGVFPMTSMEKFGQDFFPFSNFQPEKEVTCFTRRDVSRGFSRSAVMAYDIWRSGLSPENPFLARLHLPSYPLPTSFPSFFKSPQLAFSGRGILTQRRSVAMFSSIATSSQTGGLFAMYASFVANCIKHKVMLGMDADELRELVNDLCTLHEGFMEGSPGGWEVSGMDTYGEDEE